MSHWFSRHLGAFALLAAPGLATAQMDVSQSIAADGLRATEAALEALTAPTPTDQFALGGVRFLAGLESALQTRWRHGMNEGLAVMSGLPILRLPLSENPEPEAFHPEVLEAMFATVAQDMEGAVAALDVIADGDDVGLTLDLAVIWFDINSNGTRDSGEGIAEFAAFALGGGLEPGATATIRFDTADAAWLSAYAHLLAGVSEVFLALDTTSAIGRVLEARAAMDALGTPAPDPFYPGDNTKNWVDLAAMFLGALDGVPDADHSRAAHAHFLSTIADNRVFWARVATEDDNEAEWIPNKFQTSALGIPFPPDTGTTWNGVLDDAEAVLTGARLVPYWRLGDGAGLDLASVFQNPPDMNFAGLVQGWSLTNHLRAGPVVDNANMRAFSQLMRGDAALFMVILN